ncbi:MAG TPA: MraY family glycosyltransferase [Candidatus Limnocylindria bacterium]|jgi:UDP-GlcNAc:undecaprenyl-phosphate GlcNAc-1-phosphate transferase|nr:MraY family glycosyltransferase [Candidatus Limnocylindria bacterium]
MTSATAFIVAFVAAILMTPVVRGVAHNAGLLDLPSPRKVHQVPVPRLGGFAIATAFYLGMTLALVVARAVIGRRLSVETGHLPAILAGVALIAGVGMMDDLQSMRARVKLAAQVVIALVAYGLGLSIDRLDGPWGSIALGAWSLPLTVLWIVGVINALNLIDGLDGLAAGVGLIGIAAFFAIGLIHGNADPILPVLAAAAGGILGFLRFNLPPSSIIMGDSGSMLLGFVLAAVAISLTQAGVHGMPPWVPLFVLALPLADTGRVIVLRLVSGHPIFLPDRRHVHHRLLAMGMSERGVVLVLWIVSALLAAVGVALAASSR